MDIEDVRKEYEEFFDKCNFTYQIYLTNWLQHSESRNKNGHKPFTFEIYQNAMRYIDLLENAKLGVFDCDKLGGVDKVINHLQSLISSNRWKGM